MDDTEWNSSGGVSQRGKHVTGELFVGLYIICYLGLECAQTSFSCFRVFSPDCTYMHTAIIYVIQVLEEW